MIHTEILLGELEELAENREPAFVLAGLAELRRIEESGDEPCLPVITVGLVSYLEVVGVATHRPDADPESPFFFSSHFGYA